MGIQKAGIPSPGASAFFGNAARAKVAPFVGTGAPTLHTLPFGFNQGDAKKGR